MRKELRDEILVWLAKVGNKTFSEIRFKFKDQAQTQEIRDMLQNDTEIESVEIAGETYYKAVFEDTGLNVETALPAPRQFPQVLRMPEDTGLNVETASPEPETGVLEESGLAGVLPEPADGTVSADEDAGEQSEMDWQEAVRLKEELADRALAEADARNEAASRMLAEAAELKARADGTLQEAHRFADIQRAVNAIRRMDSPKSFRELPVRPRSAEYQGKHPLQLAFDIAIEQAVTGKGVRHGGDSVPFYEQRWKRLADQHGTGFLTGQAAKNFEEALQKDGERREQGFAEALVWIAMAMLKDMGYP